MSPDEVLAMATVWGNNSTDEIGRKLRKDAPIMIAGVFSVDEEMPQDQWKRYNQDTVSYLKGKYGDRLRSVVEHTDEAFRHCHYYVVPLPGEKFDSIHSGKAPARAAKIAKLSKGEQNDAYIAGMRAFQDDFFLEVGARYGQLRFGPKRVRMTRAGWVQSKAQAKIDAMVKETRQKIYDDARLQGYNDGLADGTASAASLGNKLVWCLKNKQN
ncbi:plasmid recombination protein [Xylophilus ampelinus]|uniref:Plasmid recombination enzyme n=1 Tax=Xylophilus ampelinus TaxID=54067 RepID=A0A318SDB6_9BURK|nr:plasmid recombination protein [Xylophilus ampelinus]MCS4511587.1 plasmid recombination protein [Xylophilus ampelinus]PYE74241.1 plasmid recombination enzyme [Xylophilus ampelinus]